MYFNKILAHSWTYKNALETYKISYGDQAEEKMKLDLNEVIENPNIKVACKEKAKSFLSRLKDAPAVDNNEVALAGDGNDLPAAPTTYKFINHNSGDNIQVNNNVSNTTTNNSAGPSQNAVKKRKMFEENGNEEEEAIYAAEVNEIFGNSQATPTEEIPPVYLKGTNMRVKRSTKPFIVMDPESTNNLVNVTFKFQEFQDECVDICNRQGFILETHPFNILALSSVLLLKPDQYPDDLLQYFTAAELDLTRFSLLTKMLSDEFEDISFDLNLKLQITVIIKAYMKRSGNKTTCIKSLTALLDDDHPSENKIISSLINYVQILPKTKPANNLGEIELCVTYLNPMLSHVFNTENSNLRWANKITDESKALNEQVNQRRRPDAVISLFNQSRYAESRGFGEVKTEETKKDRYLLTRDLLRLGIFSKQAIDLDNMNANINFQAVGSSVCFYLQTLIGDGLYPLIELCQITVPMAKTDLPKYVDQFDTLMLVCKAYESCSESTTQIPTEYKRQTLDSPSFKSFINGKGSKHNHAQLIFD